MDDTQWLEVLKETEKKWSLLSKSEQEEKLSYLEETAGMLLDQWIELDEKIQQLETKKDNHFLDTYYTSKGTTFFDIDMFAQAINTLKDEKPTGTEDEIRRLYLGFAYLYEDQFERAKEPFIYIVQVASHPLIKHFAYIGLGCINIRLDQIEEATVYFDKAYRLTSTDDVVYNLGICYYSINMFSLASTFFETYVKNVPEDGEAFFFLGYCYWEEQLYDEAWSAWTTAIHLLNTTEALSALAYICEWHGHHQAAIHCYERVKEKHGTSLDVLHGLAWNMALVGNTDESIQLFRQALSQDSTNENLKKSLSWLSQSDPMFKFETLE